ncbi:hypothetical protein FNH05_01105 [Amycolatopsis rhizosphaerae]|uniref:Uncharacterized protein n=1 Tax=Amycolatopsis rhizosphaerae TaxID=2053003 RepID=A0A558DMM4_9PSEU|nr:Rv3235 family protein [Amycolatopsis rhizosphaerae]TVT62275.1 hypothetical protein FNH05_01105 [Amycolatopsis rhizosphaerae]
MRALKPLKPYEPLEQKAASADPGGQLALELGSGRREQPRGRDGQDHSAPAQIRAALEAILDARSGRRPVSQLQGLTHPRLYRRLALLPPLKEARFTLRSLRGCRLSPRIYEACGTAHTPSRAFAVTARFERTETGWRCTFFDLVRPRRSRT